MSFLKNIFGKKAKQQESTTTDQPQEQKFSPEIENRADSQLSPVESKHILPAIDETIIKTDPVISVNPDLESDKSPKPEPDSLGISATSTWRTFSIFINSTFADMEAERDHLKNVFFPRLALAYSECASAQSAPIIADLYVNIPF